MGVENQIQSPSAVICGACGSANQPDAKFCAACGQGLFEPCLGCGKSVSLTQKFCGSCGADLDHALSVKHERHEQTLVDAVNAAREYDFDVAVAMMEKVASLDDYRFREVAANAKQAIEKIQQMRVKAVASANDAIATAKEQYDLGNQHEVVRILESVPAKMLDDGAKKILARVKSYTSEVSELAAALKEAVDAKNWVTVGGLVDQLLVHSPGDKRYTRVAEKVSAKLMAESNKLFDRGKYSAAADRLLAVPSLGRDESFLQLQRKYDDVDWLSAQFDAEPFATPMLGRLAVRTARDVPNDEAARERVKDLASQLKQAVRTPRCPFPAWRASNDSWVGGKVHLWGKSESIDVNNHALLKSCVSRFHVAMGLALQGLGKARVSEHYSPKKGLLKAISWPKKRKACWGVDIGHSAVKAICLAESADGVEVVDTFFEEFDEPLCRAGIEVDKHDVITAMVTKLLDEKELGEIPVWVNLPASELVSRFVRLPPVSDKQAAALLESEASQRIPIPAEELAVVNWIAEAKPGGAMGRPAVIAAAKKEKVQSRFEILAEAGLNVVGMQADTVALVNFAVYEFKDVLFPELEGDAEGVAVDESLPPTAEPDARPTVALVECGASATSIVLVSDETHWMWTVENGGEDLTATLSRRTKSIHSDAEQLKRNPAALKSPGRDYAPVEQRLDEMRMRLMKIIGDAQKQNSRFDIVQTWCFGGGCLAHQWIRRLLLRDLKNSEGN